MFSIKTISVIVSASLLLSGCASNRVESSNPLSTNSKSVAGFESLSLTSKDFDYAVQTAVQQFLEEPMSQNPEGGRWVVDISDVINDTPIIFDTSEVTSQLKRELRRSGKFIFTAATGQEVVGAIRQQRELNNSELFDQTTTAAKGTVIAPDLTIVGAIRSRNVRSPDGRKQSQTYAFDFSVVDIDTGLIIFETYVTIDKVGANKNFAW